MPFLVSAWLGALLIALAAPGYAQERVRFLNPSSMPASRGYSQLVEVPPGTRLLFFSGQVGLDSSGALRAPGDFRAQARQAFENLGAGLRAAGADFRDVIKLAFYVVDAGEIPALREVRDQFINPKSPPASTLVEVRRLFREDVLVEIEAIAAVRAAR